MSRYAKVPENAFAQLQLNAGILVAEFTPETGEFDGLFGATTGGFAFASNPTIEDLGEDMDNVPAKVAELQRITGYDPAMSGTFLSVTAESMRDLCAAADIDISDATHIIPRNELSKADFKSVWWVGDYSDKTDEEKGGYIAIHLDNALNTAGLKITSTKNGKGQFAFDYHAHVSLAALDKVPFEIFVKAGE